MIPAVLKVLPGAISPAYSSFNVSSISLSIGFIEECISFSFILAVFNQSFSENISNKPLKKTKKPLNKLISITKTKYG
jgi:hypothetical protein